MSSDGKQSIISAIPKDASNIIKDFLVEKREVCPLKINCCCNNYFITKYKEGYKIDKVLSLVKFEKENKRMSDENKEKNIDMIQKDIKKYYPIFIDEEDDLIQFFYTLYYDEYNSDDEDYDQENTMCTSISIAGCRTHCYEADFKRKLKLYMKLIGKVFGKV